MGGGVVVDRLPARVVQKPSGLVFVRLLAFALRLHRWNGRRAALCKALVLAGQPFCGALQCAGRVQVACGGVCRRGAI